MISNFNSKAEFKPISTELFNEKKRKDAAAAYINKKFEALREALNAPEQKEYLDEQIINLKSKLDYHDINAQTENSFQTTIDELMQINKRQIVRFNTILEETNEMLKVYDQRLTEALQATTKTKLNTMDKVNADIIKRDFRIKNKQYVEEILPIDNDTLAKLKHNQKAYEVRINQLQNSQEKLKELSPALQQDKMLREIGEMKERAQNQVRQQQGAQLQQQPGQPAQQQQGAQNQVQQQTFLQRLFGICSSTNPGVTDPNDLQRRYDLQRRQRETKGPSSYMGAGTGGSASRESSASRGRPDGIQR